MCVHSFKCFVGVLLVPPLLISAYLPDSSKSLSVFEGAVRRMSNFVAVARRQIGSASLPVLIAGDMNVQHSAIRASRRDGGPCAALICIFF